ncbi:Flavodoxin [Candidatus Hepatincola sp. Pdp]
MQKNILVIYGSTTGNSENLAIYIQQYISIKAKVNVVNVVDLQQNFSFEGYDVYILVTSTWGIEPADLQEDFAYFWQHVNKDSINGKSFMILGLGDAYYPYFAYGVDILVADIIQFKGKVLGNGLKIQDNWEERLCSINNYLELLLSKLNEEKIC